MILQSFDNVYINSRIEFAYIDKVSYSKRHVLKEIMELAYEMQILCQLWIKTFIPIWWWAVHANERIKGFIFISWKRQSQDRYAISIQWVQILITERIPQLLPIFTLNGMQSFG